ncbi:DEAD/DEAH box helicase [Streptantibioticus ferralitis]|uniref:DEAD/DEAH box helicase n=1 Tax=Streptantibioticus ferralitis TaxID=236510 RepID=A0ABT5YXY8_9ACTN|nr:DEAD/DEAH box helicase [Streptantibioticus ferralitis]MDF2256424.1 DEAD/DEAH box helicase [Streptantibioticus ferralitis]
MTRITGGTAQALARCAAVFEAGDPPRTGTIAFWDPAGDTPRTPVDEEVGTLGEISVVVPKGDDRGGSVSTRTVPALRLPAADALPVLTVARRGAGGQAHPAAAFWGAAAVLALQLVARGRILPGVSPQDFDAWRVGPLDAEDMRRIRELAEAMPAEARAVPLPGSGTMPGSDPLPGAAPPRLADADALLRGFLDAVADALPRTAAAVRAAGAPAFAAAKQQHVPQLRGWADEVAAGLDAGVRLSLRLEVPGGVEALGASADDGAFRAVVQLHSLADPTLMTDAAALWDSADHGFGERARIDAALAVRRAARVWPPLGRLLHRTVPDELSLADGEISELLAGASARLAAAGFDVHWPKDLIHDLTATAVVGHTDAPPSDVRGFFGTDGLLGFDWQLALGDSPLTAAEMDRLAEAHRPVVRLRDRWTLVDPDLVRKARMRELKPLTAIEALGAALTGTATVADETVPVTATGWLAALKERLADPDDVREAVVAPPGLAATLRDYQLRGLRWLDRMTSLGLGGCLADDMGLGKTITLIALHLHRQAAPATEGPTLVVCPASLLGNWEREIERFAPGTPVRRFHGGGRSLDGPRSGFVLTTYGTMRLDAAQLAERTWGLVVADEAQHVKNARSRTAKALRRIRGGGRVALTGTPVENNLSELWAILDWTTPGLLGSLSAFRGRWAKAVEGGDTMAAEELARLVKPFLLRRRKSDPGIAPELPPKTETDRPVPLTREQAGLYEAAVREAMEEISGSSGMARRGLVVKLLTACKQICNHPAQYLKEDRPVLSGRSGKLELLDELLDTILAEGGAVLVFTQYVAMARLLRHHLRGRGVETQLLYGGTPVARREEMVRSFQDGEVPVFLLSLKAAGTGLNLTRADHVVHFDRWWNPAVEEQATDRAHRIGQSRPVQVHRLIAEGTIEDRIAEMLRSKRELAEAVLSSGEAALTELSDAELTALVELRSAR